LNSYFIVGIIFLTERLFLD